MTELQAVVAAARRLRDRRRDFLIATVVRVRGSSYRQPGARLLIAGDRWITGSVSGGCLEGDIARRGAWRTAGAPAVVVTYDSTADDDREPGWGVGFGCNGAVDVLLERVDRSGAVNRPVEALLALGDETSPFALCTVVRAVRGAVPVAIGDRVAVRSTGVVDLGFAVTSPAAERAQQVLVAEAERCLRAGLLGRAARLVVVNLAGTAAEVLVEVIAPPPELFVCGGGRDAVPVVAMAHLLGWTVSVYEPRRRWATAENFPGAARLITGGVGELGAAVARAWRPLAVVMSHDFQLDRELLRTLIPSPAVHIGVLGPRRRTDKLLDELAATGAPVADTIGRRLFAPVGLSIGAETPEEIALSIVAEVQAVIGKGAGGFLRDRFGSLHEQAAALRPHPMTSHAMAAAE